MNSNSTPTAFKANLPKRHKASFRWNIIFITTTILASVFLLVFILTIIDGAFGYVILENEVDPSTLTREGILLENQDQTALLKNLEEYLSPRRSRALNHEKPLEERNRDELYRLIEDEIIKPQIMNTFRLSESLFYKSEIETLRAKEYPNGYLTFRSWVSVTFLTNSQSSEPIDAGIRGAILGSFLTILVTILAAFPLGIAAAIWLEEYAKDNKLNRFIQTNIYNLAGVPSIIYGMLGLALFVRIMEPITSGAIFNANQVSEVANGRTILSAGFTLVLLILPVIIINSQEALRAVPATLRYSSYAVGGTKWQTILHHVLPACFDRILTGTVLAISRAIGETAPLVVVGASTFLSQDPTSFFSKFTTLPIQIYQWTARPQPEFKNLAAAAILVLLFLMLSLNAAAVIIRNKFRKKKRIL
jgi:phosphate transport system permease protein